MFTYWGRLSLKIIIRCEEYWIHSKAVRNRKVTYPITSQFMRHILQPHFQSSKVAAQRLRNANFISKFHWEIGYTICSEVPYNLFGQPAEKSTRNSLETGVLFLFELSRLNWCKSRLNQRDINVVMRDSVSNWQYFHMRAACEMFVPTNLINYILGMHVKQLKICGNELYERCHFEDECNIIAQFGRFM